MLICVGLTTLVWLVVTWLTFPSDEKTLVSFYQLIRPSGPGWSPISGLVSEPVAETGTLPRGILMMFLGTTAIYSTLFATGYWLYGETLLAVFTTLTSLVSGRALFIMTFHKKR